MGVKGLKLLLTVDIRQKGPTKIAQVEILSASETSNTGNPSNHPFWSAASLGTYRNYYFGVFDEGEGEGEGGSLTDS